MGIIGGHLIGGVLEAACALGVQKGAINCPSSQSELTNRGAVTGSQAAWLRHHVADSAQHPLSSSPFAACLYVRKIFLEK